MAPIQTICVCGAGTMGSGIAQVSAAAGFSTILFDVNETMLEKSKASIEKNLLKLSERGKLPPDEVNKILDRMLFTASIDHCRADLIIEAIIEEREAKATLFRQLAAINQYDCILATNTSSIPVSEVATTIPVPARFAGMHFFNPAPLMKLVEVVRGKQTSEETINQLLTVSKQMDKTPVVCKDAPGFIVNRVARHYYLEAMRLVETGKADIATVDSIMEASGFKMGPFRLMDLIGMDINYNVSRIVWEALGKPERLHPSPLQKSKVDAGELGRKTGKGFYEYI
ncbi:3-hydroxybutyryl-CoA dehydrogenase [Hydrobacter penzbergensis]|uniref:3-hydroxybutyryl-CoA dehydrogenase n=1 Tax=Hydrobacter penzbergensis TaxID=1235997 RepID=A0A8X8LB24_9BACT|nr:3-hydroxyacyl-CoA dehydrogenase NAD-binding domain-containing protein [Hydrobacter penzbergensis]SDW70637.1 3-hydroxybutyryl-CoA dehydrogenase [Hydrobacter penzbergensis]